MEEPQSTSPPPIRLLLVEDQRSDAGLIFHELSKAGISIDSRVVDNEKDFIDALDLFVPDVILSDYSLPAFSAMAALELVLAKAPSIPFIIVTSSINEETAVESMKAGASDYVLKERLIRLPNSITRALEIRRTNREKERVEDQARASLLEKELLLREIHHRVKNNLQIISSLLSLQSQHLRNDESAGVLEDTQSRIRAMALIHEKLYQSRNLSRVNFAEYTKSMCSALFYTYGLESQRVSLTTDVDGVEMDINRAIPCALIANELVSNSLKYAFPAGTGGEMYITLRRVEGGKLMLTVGDKGVGMPATYDPVTCESLGLKLVRILVEQIQGTLELSTEGGTEFRILFSEE